MPIQCQTLHMTPRGAFGSGTTGRPIRVVFVSSCPRTIRTVVDTVSDTVSSRRALAVAVEQVSASAYTVPTDRPASDGTLAWESPRYLGIAIA